MMRRRPSSNRHRGLVVSVDLASGDRYAAGSVQAELEHPSRLATVVLNEHVNDHGLCVMCGCAFPCELAVLAEHKVALCSPPRRQNRER